jgi:hypothetical protein
MQRQLYFYLLCPLFLFVSRCLSLLYVVLIFHFASLLPLQLFICLCLCYRLTFLLTYFIQFSFTYFRVCFLLFFHSNAPTLVIYSSLSCLPFVSYSHFHYTPDSLRKDSEPMTGRLVLLFHILEFRGSILLHTAIRQYT